MKSKASTRRWVIIPLLALLLHCCSREVEDGSIHPAGILLSFDDDRVDNWYTYLPFMDSAGLRATFYVSNYRGLTRHQRNKLHVIREHGHEIGFHGTSHFDMIQYLVSWHHTIGELMQNEVEAGLAAMQRDGFNPVSFAHPYGSHTGEIDQALKKYFRTVRAVNGTNDYRLSLAARGDYCLHGFGLDEVFEKSDNQLRKLLEAAKDHHCVAVLNGHNISSKINPSVSLERLRYLVQVAGELGLRFYKAEEMGR